MRISSDFSLKTYSLKHNPNSFMPVFKSRRSNYDAYDSSFSRTLKEISFLNSNDRQFVYTFLGKSKKVTKSIITETAIALDKEKALAPEHKRNLFEHMLLKVEQDKPRDLKMLLFYIKFFSSNKKLPSVIISDSSKYLLENPEVNPSVFYDVVSDVVRKNQSNDSPSDLLKISKLLYEEPEKLKVWFKKGCTFNQLSFLNNFSAEFIQKLRKTYSISDLTLNEKFVFLNGLNLANTKTFDKSLSKMFPILPRDKHELKLLKEKIQMNITDIRPINLKSQSYNSVADVIKDILKNNQPENNQNISDFYRNLSSQILFEPFNFSIASENRFLSSRILKAYSYMINDNDPNSIHKASVLLLDKNVFGVFKNIFGEENKEKASELESIINELSSQNKKLKQDTFEKIDEQYVKVVHFKDGTENKIINVENIRDGKPCMFLHSSSPNVTGLLPIYGKLPEQDISNCIFSATYSNETNIVNPFRKFGVVLHVDEQNILGGANYDMATGYDKNIDNFTETFFSDKYKKIRDYFKFKNYTTDNHDISQEILTTQRIDGRQYNEFLLLSPSIVAIYAYTDDLDEIPYDYRKFAQDNNLYIINLKTKKSADNMIS